MSLIATLQATILAHTVCEHFSTATYLNIQNFFRLLFSLLFARSNMNLLDCQGVLGILMTIMKLLCESRDSTLAYTFLEARLS